MKSNRSLKLNKMPKLRRWVIKTGSQMVCSGGPLLLRAWMQQIATLKNEHNVEVIWVTSGAIASAVDRTQFKRSGLLSEKQALSAIGQPIVMDLYNLALHAVGLMGAQILLTYDDLVNEERRQNFQTTVEKLLEWDVIPILNENDAVATEEIKFGDNDSLSAKVAQWVRAERLLILTDVEGLFASDPRKNPRAKLISELPEVNDRWLNLVKGSTTGGSSRGTGGMFSKLKAAQEAARNGIETWLLRGDIPSVLLRVAQNEQLGTHIHSLGSVRKVTKSKAKRKLKPL